MTRICTIAMVLTCAALQAPAALDAVERCDPAAFAALNSSSVTIRSAERADSGPLPRAGERVGGPRIPHSLRGLDPRTLERQARRHRQRRLRQYAEHARHDAGPGGRLRGDWRRHRPPDGDARRLIVGRGPPGANHRLGIALDSRHHRTRPADRRSGRRREGPALGTSTAARPEDTRRTRRYSAIHRISTGSLPARLATTASA